MRAPLEDPRYVPENPPVNGNVPEVVAKWGARSQLRWFSRFYGQIKPQKSEVWARFYCESESHRGPCCTSCIDDKNSGYDDDFENCCCIALHEKYT